MVNIQEILASAPLAIASRDGCNVEADPFQTALNILAFVCNSELVSEYVNRLIEEYRRQQPSTSHPGMPTRGNGDRLPTRNTKQIQDAPRLIGDAGHMASMVTVEQQLRHDNGFHWIQLGALFLPPNNTTTAVEQYLAYMKPSARAVKIANTVGHAVLTAGQQKPTWVENGVQNTKELLGEVAGGIAEAVESVPGGKAILDLIGYSSPTPTPSASALSGSSIYIKNSGTLMDKSSADGTNERHVYVTKDGKRQDASVIPGALFSNSDGPKQMTKDSAFLYARSRALGVTIVTDFTQLSEDKGVSYYYAVNPPDYPNNIMVACGDVVNSKTYPTQVKKTYYLAGGVETNLVVVGSTKTAVDTCYENIKKNFSSMVSDEFGRTVEHRVDISQDGDDEFKAFSGAVPRNLVRPVVLWQHPVMPVVTGLLNVFNAYAFTDSRERHVRLIATAPSVVSLMENLMVGWFPPGFTSIVYTLHCLYAQYVNRASEDGKMSGAKYFFGSWTGWGRLISTVVPMTIVDVVMRIYFYQDPLDPFKFMLPAIHLLSAILSVADNGLRRKVRNEALSDTVALFNSVFDFARTLQRVSVVLFFAEWYGWSSVGLAARMAASLSTVAAMLVWATCIHFPAFLAKYVGRLITQSDHSAATVGVTGIVSFAGSAATFYFGVPGLLAQLGGAVVNWATKTEEMSFVSTILANISVYTVSLLGWSIEMPNASEPWLASTAGSLILLLGPAAVEYGLSFLWKKFKQARLENAASKDFSSWW